MRCFLFGLECGRLISNRRYDGRWEWPLLSCNYSGVYPEIGMIVGKRWNWCGIVNRGWGPDGYGCYYRNEYMGSEGVKISWGMKRWGWEYEVVIGCEKRWLWRGEFEVI